MTTWIIRFDDNGEGLSEADIAELEGLVTTLGFTATISSAPVPAPPNTWKICRDTTRRAPGVEPWLADVYHNAKQRLRRLRP
jgi:hypothetical protein